MDSCMLNSYYLAGTVLVTSWVVSINKSINPYGIDFFSLSFLTYEKNKTSDVLHETYMANKWQKSDAKTQALSKQPRFHNQSFFQSLMTK